MDTSLQRVREVGGLAPVSLATTTLAPSTSTRYDGDGHAVSATDANGHTSLSAYDPLGRMVIQTNPISGTSIMTYTATELQQQRDAQGNVTTYGYDNAGRRTLVTEPVTGTVQYQYDAVGNTVALTNADTAGHPLQTETRIYDALNRVTSDSVTGPGTPPTTLTTLTAYTRDGQVAQTQQPNGDTTTTGYDLADEALSTTLLSNGTPTTEGTYGYDGAGNQATSTDTDGRTVTTVYDPDNRVTQTTATGGGTVTVATAMGYDPDGNTVAATARTTDNVDPARVQVSTRAATYDAGDRVATETDNGLTTVYGDKDVSVQWRSMNRKRIRILAISVALLLGPMLVGLVHLELLMHPDITKLAMEHHTPWLGVAFIATILVDTVTPLTLICLVVIALLRAKKAARMQFRLWPF